MNDMPPPPALDDLVRAFTQSRDDAAGHPTGTHAGVAAVVRQIGAWHRAAAAEDRCQEATPRSVLLHSFHLQAAQRLDPPPGGA